MREDLLKIIETYGTLNQLKHFQSEVYELTEAIFDYEYTNKWNCADLEKHLKEHIVEEMADVQVMLEQFQYYYGIENYEIDLIMNKKINRQLERIERGE